MKDFFSKCDQIHIFLRKIGSRFENTPISLDATGAWMNSVMNIFLY